MSKSQSKRKCIIVLNGPSVYKLKMFVSTICENTDKVDIIACNRWFNIFKILELPTPNYVVIGKNSLQYNIPFIKQLPYTTFYGIDPYPMKNYRRLKFGKCKVYGKEIDMKGALWWSGLYALQLALKKEYDEIHIFGFTCTDQPDFKDRLQRAPIKHSNILKIESFLQELKDKGLMDKITFYEDKWNHIFGKLI